MVSNVKPQAREAGLVIEGLDNEVLVYDLDRHKAHCLETTAALVWRYCDGKTGVAEIAAHVRRDLKTPVDDDVVWVALRRLGKANLLEQRVKPPVALAGRRDVLKKAALLGGLSVLSILAPTAAQAATGCRPKTSCKHVLKNGVPETGLCCNTDRICHITVDGGGTCGPEICVQC
jgi:hypothetical protein